MNEHVSRNVQSGTGIARKNMQYHLATGKGRLLVLRGRKGLEWLLGYVFRLAARHRDYVSVVMVCTREDKINVRQLLRDTLRDSDEFFELGRHSAIVMPYTGREDARNAVERYQARCNGEVDMRYSIASYPGDAGTVGDMLRTGERRLEKAKGAGFGAMIGNG